MNMTSLNIQYSHLILRNDCMAVITQTAGKPNMKKK
jgi:hypothetical protein